jgi:hypothetical protein
MPASFIAEVILQPILELVFQVGAYYLGRVIVPVISFGQWKCDQLLRDVPKKKLKWSGAYHLRGKQVYLTAEATSGIGLVFFGLVIGVFLWWYFRL